MLPTVAAPAPGELSGFHAFLDDLGIAPDDQVVRPIAHEGVASAGVVITRASLVPEITVTAEGVYWHPVAATDEQALVTRRVEPLTPVLDADFSGVAEQWAARRARPNFSRAHDSAWRQQLTDRSQHESRAESQLRSWKS